MIFCLLLSFLTPLFGEASLTLGYRSDSLDWSKCESGQHWDSQRLFDVGVEGSVCLKSILLRADANFGAVLAGDFRSCGPLDRFDSLAIYGLTPQRKGTPRGYTARVRSAIGLPAVVCGVTATPLFGWSYFHQQLHTKTLTSKVQTVIGDESFNISAKIRQTLHTNWNGPFIGTDLFFPFDACLRAFGHVYIHFDTFQGRAEKQESLSCEEEECLTTHLERRTIGYELEGGLTGKITSCSDLYFAIEYDRLINNDYVRFHSLNFKLGLSTNF